MAYRATHRFARISPRKVRPLADLIRGKDADAALEALRFLPHRGARMLEKVLKSALGNAEDQDTSGAEGMIVVDARADLAARIKRIRPRARGMAYPILKRTSHIHVRLEDV